MGFIQRRKADGKASFLGVMQAQLEQLAVKELASGKLVSPTNFDVVYSKAIRAWRKNPLTGTGLKLLGVKDEELREVIKAALIGADVEEL